MAPAKKARNQSGKTSHVNGISPKKDGENACKSRKRKRKLSDMLGPQWSKKELERFYEAYREYGKDWKKVAASIRSRSVEMVEALYTMNRAYLSLPEGTASVIGLIAMMTDHYCVLGSDSEQGSSKAEGTPKKPKRARAKSNEPLKGLEGPSGRLPFNSSTGCLSLLKKRRTESVLRAVGKRTPRIPVSYSREKDNKERYFSPVRQDLRIKEDGSDDDMAHEIAIALTEASQRGGSPQVSQTLSGKAKIRSPIKRNGRKHIESDTTIGKFRGSEIDEDGCELSLESAEADNGDYAGIRCCLKATEDSQANEIHHWGRRQYRKVGIENCANDNLDDVKEACSGTEEGDKLGTSKAKYERESDDGKSACVLTKGLRKRSKNVLPGRDEGAAFDALQALADLSLMMPETATDTESSVLVKEEKIARSTESKLKGSSGTLKAPKRRKFLNHDANISLGCERNDLDNSTMRNTRQKPSPIKVRKDEGQPVSSVFAGSPSFEEIDEVNKIFGRSKRSQNASRARERKAVKPHERTSSSNDHYDERDDPNRSTLQVVSSNQVNLQTKVRSRRKIGTQKLMKKDDNEYLENIADGQSDKPISSICDNALVVKERLSHCLSRYQARKWCVFEWFYSAIDYPWFAKQEFVEYLHHVGLGHIPRLTRIEWGVIRSSLGKPRRFSEQFLKEEKEKLNQYRESVRKHYAELHFGIKEGLPTDLAPPLKVGQRVITLHPKSREIHDGSVLTVDHSRYRIQFDRPELGVEFVKDIDCMPFSRVENMPASLLRHHINVGCYFEHFGDSRLSAQANGRMAEGYFKVSSCENVDNSKSSPVSTAKCHVNGTPQHQKVDGAHSSYQPKLGFSEASNVPQAVNFRPSDLLPIQAREANVRALSELTWALDKKELIVSELKRMNDEFLEDQNCGHNALKDSETFRKHYAAILFQLSEVNEQVSSALLHLRQRNTYPENLAYPCSRSTGSIAEMAGLLHSDKSQTQECGSSVVEIISASNIKAHKMVVTALQAMASLKKEKRFQKIEEAIDFINTQLSVDYAAVDLLQKVSGRQDNLVARAASQIHDSQPSMPEQKAAQIPSGLITCCVATLFMIQKCAERQVPPGDVAQVLDSAVASLQPRCSQNLPIYAEIRKCMGIIRNQILALVPT